MIEAMEFQNPLTLFLLLLLIPAIWLLLRPKRYASLKFSYINGFKTASSNGGPSLRKIGRYFLVLCRLACIVLLVLAIARPQKGKKVQLSSTNGVVMQMVLDRSSSMKAEMDYYGNSMTRLQAAKEVLTDFVKGGNGLEGRPNDLIGLISFAAFPDTNCPLVKSPEMIVDFLSEINMAEYQFEDGTAIGDAIALSAARLHKAEEEIEARNARLKAISEQDDKDSKAKSEFVINSKVIVLLTDGNQNRGDIDPQEAVEMAKKWGIKIYTVGIGSPPQRSNSIFDMMRGVEFDERLLKWIASETGGQYTRAGNAEDLKEFCEKIDKLEKSEIQSISYNEYDEKFHLFGYGALAALMIELVAGCTVFRRVP